MSLKLYVSQLAKPSTPADRTERTEVPLDGSRFLCVAIETELGEVQLTEADDGSLHLHAPNGGFVIHPRNANSLDLEIRGFGQPATARRRSRSKSARTKRR